MEVNIVWIRSSVSIAILLVGVDAGRAASIIVAAANSTPEAKARADLVCGGKDDQVVLLSSLTRAVISRSVVTPSGLALTRIKRTRVSSLTGLPL